MLIAEPWAGRHRLICNHTSVVWQLPQIISLDTSCSLQRALYNVEIRTACRRMNGSQIALHSQINELLLQQSDR